MVNFSLAEAQGTIIGHIVLSPLAADRPAYALAEVAVRAMVAQVGWSKVLDEAYARTHGGAAIADASVLAWYRDALARLRTGR